jgi:hypothetical protein
LTAFHGSASPRQGVAIVLRRSDPSRSVTGPFYWFPSPGQDSPCWGLLAGHDFGLDPDTGHVELWRHVLTRLAAAWGKEATFVKRLALAYTGLPRGRVTKPGRVYLVLHGNDAPTTGLEGRIRLHFDLGRQQVKLLYDEHETMISGHPKAVETLLGCSLVRPATLSLSCEGHDVTEPKARR